jgi:hypothetical protein
VPSISIKDTLQQTAGLVVTEVANWRKTILTLALIHSLSRGRPTAYVPRGHYFRFNGAPAVWLRQKGKRKTKLETASAVIYGPGNDRETS